MVGSKRTRSTAERRKRKSLRLGLHRRKPLKPDDPTRIHAFHELQTKPKLVSFLLDAALSDSEIRTRIRSIADSDVSRRKIFVHGLGDDSTDETLTEAFSPFGPIEDCSVVRDNITGRANGYGFVVYKTRSGAEKAMKEPRRTVKNRMIWCQLASVGPARPDDSVPSGISKAQRRKFTPLMERTIFVDAAMNHGLVNLAGLGGATRSAYGGGMVREPYGEVAYGGAPMRLAYGGGMVGASYGGAATRLPYGKGVRGMPYGGGRWLGRRERTG